MAKISIFLKGPYQKDKKGEFIKVNGIKQIDKTKQHTVYVRYQDGRRLDFSASLKVKTFIKDWDKKELRIRKRNSLPYQKHNGRIDGIIKLLKDYDKDCFEKGYLPSRSDLKNKVISYDVEGKDVRELELLEFIDEFIDRAKREPNPNTGKLVSTGTIKSYLGTKSVLKMYHETGKSVDFESITLDWYYDFTEWSNSQNYALNTLGRHIKTLKTFLNRAVELGLTKNIDFRSRRFMVVSEDADDIYLNNDELSLLYHKDLTKFEKHDIVRDMFLIGCYTGLRISDFNRLKDHNIKKVNNVRMITIKNKKSGRQVALPIHPVVEQILIKHGGIPSGKVNDTTVNKLIKDVAEWCGIDEVVYKTTTRGNLKVEEKYLKHELVKSHTARRSFCTNAYLNGVDSMDIMALSGHTTEKSFKKYIKVTPEQIAIRMSESPFFKDTSVLLSVVK